MNRTLSLLCSVIGLWLATPSHAADINAASCAHSAVQAAINAAVNGDRVLVPAGNCTWTTTVIVPTGKGITLQGAGIDQTNITDQGASGQAIQINATAAAFVTLTGFTFIKDTDHPNGIISIAGPFEDVAFRIHHIRILHATAGSRGIATVGVYGLIDHVTFDVTATSGSIQNVSPSGTTSSTDGGFTSWQKPLSLGTNKAIYVEDSTFNYGSPDEDAIDAYSGARFVIRHNTFNNAHIGFHGTDSGQMRSPVSFEIYNNTFTNNSPTKFRGGTIRGGTGVWHNNTYGGTQSWYSITALLYRASPCTGTFSWNVSDGTAWELGSTNLSANANRICTVVGSPQRVKFCSGNRETLCVVDGDCGGQGTCSAHFDGTGTGGYPARDQPGIGPGQVVNPIYAWNNSGGVTIDAWDAGCPNSFGIANYLQSGRDYINGSARPGYSPYTYPHPLQAGVPPAAPASLKVSGLLSTEDRSSSFSPTLPPSRGKGRFRAASGGVGGPEGYTSYEWR
jgi:hypothetical protein